MFEMFKTLAISVEAPLAQQEAEALARQAQEAQERTLWIILLCICLVAEILIALVLPKMIKKHKAKKEAKEFRKAERKRIQSKR